ncbi:cytotoxic T-lymphocyte protein 4-like isoform X2 [Engraulis encrasicolus]|uniref:cytotoxic T-lymphocyte protein 4-like isoform X2 n=1 Tax=Engraulis encrasicolus TaxID=184585 RepID=UPI002FD63B0F
MPHRDMSQCTANIFILLNLLCSAAPEKCKHDVCIVQPYRVVATEGVATVECRYSSPPHPHPEELSVALLKGLHGNEVVCWGKLNSTQLSWSTSGEPHACHTRMTNRGFNITVSGLKGGDTDIYRCQVVVRYPPPYRTRTGNGTLVYVPGERETGLFPAGDSASRGPQTTTAGTGKLDPGTNGDRAREAGQGTAVGTGFPATAAVSAGLNHVHRNLPDRKG